MGSMMLVTLEFLAQARTAAGQERAEIAVEDGSDLLTALRTVARQQPEEAIQTLLFDQQGKLRTSLLLMVNGALVRAPAEHALRDGDTITLLPPIGGG